MKNVIVTISFYYDKKSTAYDIELPCEVPVNELSVHIAETLNGYHSRFALSLTNATLYSPRLKRTLKPDETLDSAGVWNGDYINLEYPKQKER